LNAGSTAQTIRNRLRPLRPALRYLRSGAARIEAESCYKTIEKYNSSSDEHFRARAILVKEERAELAKHHIDVLWSDYFKPEHVQKHPEITELCWNAAKQASKVKQSLDLNEARTLTR